MMIAVCVLRIRAPLRVLQGALFTIFFITIFGLIKSKTKVSDVTHRFRIYELIISEMS